MMLERAVNHRPGFAVGLGPLLVAAAAGAAVAAEAPATGAAERRPPAPTKSAAVLDLVGDGFLVGGLVPAPAAAAGPRATLVWRTPLFKSPIEFDIDGIERIRFPRVDGPRPPATDWRVGLRGGDFVIGAIDAVDADHVVLAVPGVAGGTLRIRRAAIERIGRDTAAGRVVVPGGLDGWDVGRGEWQEQAGRLASDTVGAAAFRDVAAPARACYDLVLSWDERPELDIYLASDAVRPKVVAKDKKVADDTEWYRVELAAGDLLAIREGSKSGKFDLAGSIPPGAGGLRLRAFVDQQTGRMAVVLPARETGEKPVFDETLEPRKAGVRSGFGIRIRSGGVRIDGLRVVPWTVPELRMVGSGGLGGPDAVLESFDKQQGTFTFRGPDGPRQVAAGDVPVIEFPAADAADAAPPGSVMAAFHGGTRLSGRILEVTERGLRLDCPAVADPLACEFGQLAEIESLVGRPSAPLPSRPGRLEADTSRMLGCLANVAGGVGWQPRGAVAAVPIDPTVPLRISYRGIAALGGVGLEFAKQGVAWVVTDVPAGGPAARDGQIKPGWRLEAIKLDAAAQPIDVGPLKPADLRGLLRGVAGSTVVLRIAAPAGKPQEIPLVRDAAGRGDLAGAAEQDVLEQSLKLQEARVVVGAAPAGQATVYLKTGDSITCTVVAADPAGLRIRTDVGGETVVPAVALRAVELLPSAGAGIPKEKLARLLTLPRMQQADPPTHMIRLPNGDYLRGKLVSLDEKAVRIDVLGVVKSLPRADVTRLIWLSVEGDETEAQAVAAVMGGPEQRGIPTRVTMTDGRRLSLAAERVDGDRLVGASGVLGTTGVDLDRCDHLELGRAAIAARPGDELPYAKWKLKPAPGPRALQKGPPTPRQPRADVEPQPPPVREPPTLAVIPVLPLLEPDAAGRRNLSAGVIEGQVAVLGLVEVGDKAGLGRLVRLAEIVAAFEPEGVVGTAVVAGGSREEVARAVGELKPKPPIAFDQAARVRAAWGDPALPACLLVDREGRVADVLPLADGAERIRARVAELVAASKDTRREFQALTRARERALAGDRGCLDDLGELLVANSEAVRRRACGQLRRLTGLWEKDMPFRADGPPDVRAGEVRQWRQWLAKEGVSAKLVFPKPVAAEWDDGRPITGRTLVCRPQNGDTVELDENGREIAKLPIGTAWACDVTPEGNRLVGDHTGKAVVEFDANGKEVWAVRGLPGGPMSARRLANGNTLVALSDANLVAEYDPKGKTAWSAEVEGRPCDARRLPDGTTLVAAHRGNRIVEIDATGKEISVMQNIDDPQTVQPLPNGHMLVAMSTPGIVREIDRDGRVIWERDGFKVPVDAQRLPDGRTLVQEQQGDLVELGADGAELGRTATGGSRFLRF